MRGAAVHQQPGFASVLLIGRWLLLWIGSVLLCPLAAPLAAATRQQPPVVVCVLVPRVEALDEGDAFGEVPIATPSLLVLEPLQEVRIETADGRLLWRRRSHAAAALPSPLPWPLPPLHSRQQVVLRLQPVGSGNDAYAHVQLRAADAARLRDTSTLIARLGRQGPAWLQAINQALLADDAELAFALLVAPQAPDAGPLRALLQEVRRRGCGDHPSP